MTGLALPIQLEAVSHYAAPPTVPKITSLPSRMMPAARPG